MGIPWQHLQFSDNNCHQKQKKSNGANFRSCLSSSFLKLSNLSAVKSRLLMILSIAFCKGVLVKRL